MDDFTEPGAFWESDASAIAASIEALVEDQVYSALKDFVETSAKDLLNLDHLQYTLDMETTPKADDGDPETLGVSLWIDGRGRPDIKGRLLLKDMLDFELVGYEGRDGEVILEERDRERLAAYQSAFLKLAAAVGATLAKATR
jgi:hypothetical protein